MGWERLEEIVREQRQIHSGRGEMGECEHSLNSYSSDRAETLPLEEKLLLTH